MSFMARQMLDALSPSNFAVTNPDLFQETMRTGGGNLIHGTQHAFEDMQRNASGTPAPGFENFKVGKNMAVTPGHVVFRNHLIELIQYEPQTKTVYKEPVLMLPAWIMKYYILDLSPDNSLVNWLVKQGHTVFMVSWRNPDAADRNLGMDDYYRMGAMAAIDAVSGILPNIDIHLMGYCLGGTLAIITASAMAANKDKRIKSLTMLAAQADFTEAGELMLFITESEISFLKNMMWEKGYLGGKQMEGTFQLLHSKDLVWSTMLHDYMMDKRRPVIDLLAWNADATRLSYKMHSEYLEKLYLHNDFVESVFTIGGSDKGTVLSIINWVGLIIEKSTCKAIIKIRAATLMVIACVHLCSCGFGWLAPMSILSGNCVSSILKASAIIGASIYLPKYQSS